MAKPPIIILPSREQDYTDPYFRMIFPKAVRLLRESSVLMIVGYSLPEDDALIRFIIKQFAEHVDDGRGKLIFYISPDDDSYKRTVVKDVFPATDTDVAPNHAHALNSISSSKYHQRLSEGSQHIGSKRAAAF